MVVSLVAPLVKRGVEAGVHCMHRMAPAFNVAATPGSIMVSTGNVPPQKDIHNRLKNPMAILTLAVTAIVFCMAMMAIEYSIRIVALNLTLVENVVGHGSIQLPVDGELPDDLNKTPLLDDYDDRVPALPSKAARKEPITAGIRSTMRHLNSVGGFFSRFRGASYGIFYGVCFTMVYSVLSGLLSFFGYLGIAVSMLLTSALTCNLRAAWTHATFAQPSDAGFFQRFLPRKTAAKLILPNLRAHIAVLLTQVVTASHIFIAERTLSQHGVNWLSINVVLLPIVASLLMGMFVILPCHIALIRAEASLLPEGVGSIVPFDRTFGGRVTWEFESCGQKFYRLFSISGAIKTLDKKIFKRALMVVVKLCAISLAMGMSFALLVGFELFVILGKENVKWVIGQVHR